MKYKEFIKLDLDYLKENCNFTDSEWQYLLLKCNEYTNFMIEEEMHITKTKVDNLAAAVKSKIYRVQNNIITVVKIQ